MQTSNSTIRRNGIAKSIKKEKSKEVPKSQDKGNERKNKKGENMTEIFKVLDNIAHRIDKMEFATIKDFKQAQNLIIALCPECNSKKLNGGG